MNRIFRTLCVLVTFIMVAFIPPSQKKKDPDFISIQNKWVDSVFNILTPKERLGQLLWLQLTVIKTSNM